MLASCGFAPDVTPTSLKVAAIGACGLWMVTATAAHRAESREHGVGDRAGGGLDQPVAFCAQKASLAHLDHLVVGDRVGELVGRAAAREIDVEHEIEREGLPDLGLVRHHAVIGVQRQAR